MFKSVYKYNDNIQFQQKKYDYKKNKLYLHNDSLIIIEQIIHHK